MDYTSNKNSLSQTELLILLELRKNSRASLADISRITNIPASTVFDKLGNLNKKAIKKHVSLFDFSKLGYNLRVGYFIKAKDKDKLREYLSSHRSVNTIYKTSNGYDFFVDAVFKNFKENHDFKEKLQEFDLENLQEHHIVDEIKHEGFLTDKEHLGLI